MNLDFDPIWNRYPDDPYPVYKELRERAPVFYAPRSELFVMTRYDDVEWVFKSADLFSSKPDRR